MHKQENTKQVQMFVMTLWVCYLAFIYLGVGNALGSLFAAWISIFLIGLAVLAGIVVILLALFLFVYRQSRSTPTKQAAW